MDSRFTFTDRAHPIAEVDIGDERIPVDPGRWDVSRWDAADALWWGAEWLDIACDVRSFTCEYGHARTTDRFVPGVATVIVDNHTGWADPMATDPGILQMRPGRQIRLGVWHEVFGTRWLFRGFIDSVVPHYEPADRDTVTFQCVDALGEVNRAKLKPLADPAYAGERADQRIARILDLAGWDPTKRDLWGTSDTLVADELGGQVADLLGQAADSSGGVIFGDTAGIISFRPRDWQTYAPGSTNDGSIGNVVPYVPGYWTDAIPQVDGYLAPAVVDTGATENLTDPRGRVWTASSSPAIVRRIPAIPPQWVPATGDVCPIDWTRPFDRASIATRVLVGRSADTAQVFDDLAAQQLYGIEPFERTDLLTELDSRITEIGQRYLATRGASTAPRVRSVSFDAATSVGALDLMTTVDVFKPSRYRCRLELERGMVFDEEMFATGVVHSVDTNRWTLDVNLDAASPYELAGVRWDYGWWDQSAWADAVAAHIEDLLALVTEIGVPA